MAKCQSCMGARLKTVLREKFPTPRMFALLETIPDCPSDTGLVMCQKVAKAKREPSAYQTFVSECMKAKHLKGFDPGAMKDCAAQWKKRPR